MKKVFLAVLMAVMFCGCDDIKPTSWGVNENWEMWGQGKLVGMEDIQHPKCRCRKQPCRNTGHPRCTKYVFDNGREVTLRLIKDPGKVVVGQTGKLYKYVYSGRSKDYRSWFQWVTDSSVPVTTVTTKTVKPKKVVKDKSALITYGEIPKAIYPKEKIVKRYDWKTYPDVRPAKFQTVLMKFKSGTVTTGYLNSINEWKAEINRSSEDGGKNYIVIAWKEIDLN